MLKFLVQVEYQARGQQLGTRSQYRNAGVGRPFAKMVSTKPQRVRLEAIQDILTAVQRIATVAEAGRVPLWHLPQVNIK